MKKTAKRAVAQARAMSEDDFYANLENAPNDKDIFKLAKQRYRNSKDTKSIKFIKNDQGQLLTSNEDINNRWKEYYSKLLNEGFPSENLHEIPAIEGAIACITPEEVFSSIRTMSNHKAAGPDEIPAEFWKRMGEDGVKFLTKLFNRILCEGIPDQWRRSYLVPFYKNKGDIRLCGNYRAIKLISHTFKMWERILNKRLLKLTNVSENQCGFVAGKSTTDAIHSIRILMEKFRANRTDLHMTFIDLEKAFDRVPRELIWQALRAQGVPEHYIHLVKDMYRDVTTKVRSPAGISEEFEVKVGVHQGSALSPLLFNLVMNHLTVQIQRPPPWDILYADDIVLTSEDPSTLQRIVEQWREALERAGLRVSREKTEYMHCNFSNTNENASILLQNHQLKKVIHFKYLGSIICNDGSIDMDVTHRINTGWMKWRELTGVLCDSKMPVRIKGKVYKTAVRPAMMHGAECWPLKKQQENKVHCAEMKMLRWAGGVTRLDHVRNNHIRGSFKVKPIQDKLAESRLRWYGHVMRRPPEHMTRKVLDVAVAPQGRGRPRLTWMAVVRKDMEAGNLRPETTQDRPAWRRMIRRADPK